MLLKSPVMHFIQVKLGQNVFFTIHWWFSGKGKGHVLLKDRQSTYTTILLDNLFSSLHN